MTHDHLRLIAFWALLTASTWLVAQLLLPAAIHAQPMTDPVAAELKQRGDAAIDAGLYEEALDAYTRAQAIESQPALHYNRGRALQALGRFAEALVEFEAFERTAPPSLRAAVPRLQDMIDSVRSHVGSVEVITLPKTAHIYVDGKQVVDRNGPTLDEGEHVLRVEAAEYKSHEQRFTVLRGQRSTLTVELSAVPKHGLISVKSPVVGALLYVDDRARGTAPMELSLPPGLHQLTLRRDGFVETRSSIIVEAGQRRQLDIALEREPQIYERWWFWVAAGAAVAAGVVTTIALTTEKSPGQGDIAPGRISAPRLAF